MHLGILDQSALPNEGEQRVACASPAPVRNLLGEGGANSDGALALSSRQRDRRRQASSSSRPYRFRTFWYISLGRSSAGTPSSACSTRVRELG